MSHRTQITLTDAQYARLKRESEATGLGLAELVRRALAAMYGNARHEDPIDIINTSHGAWADRELDGAVYVDELRPGIVRRLNR